MRWILLIVSLGCFIMGFLVKWRNPTLPTQPEEVNVAEATAKLDTWKTYVSLSASIDLNSKIYTTSVTRPVYSLKPTNEVHSVTLISNDPENELAEYLGATVRIKRKIGSMGVRMQMVEDKVGKNKVKSERLLAPLEGTNGKVWVLTGEKDGAGGGELSGAGGFEGVLTRFMDFDKNLESYIEDYSLKKIRSHLKKEEDFEVPEKAYLIIMGLGKKGENLFYSPVKDSKHTLYVAMVERLVKDPPDPIVGIMESWSTREAGSLGTLLNESPPEKIGVIRPGWTVEKYNKSTIESVYSLFLVGGVSVLFAGVGFLRKSLRRKRERRSAEQSKAQS